MASLEIAFVWGDDPLVVDAVGGASAGACRVCVAIAIFGLMVDGVIARGAKAVGLTGGSLNATLT